jgi:hypothetical protein
VPSFAEHISEDVWSDFVEERVPADTAARIQAHLNTGCKKCAGQLARWRRMLAMLERSRVPEPPASVLRRAFDLFPQAAPRPGLLDRVIASLAFDSRANLMPAMARASTGASFNLVFTAADTSVYLWCEFDGVRWQVNGQVQAEEEGAFTSVVAVRAGGEADAEQGVRAEVDEDGEFRLPDLASGGYDLLLPGAGREVILPAVNLLPT